MVSGLLKFSPVFVLAGLMISGQDALIAAFRTRSKIKESCLISGIHSKHNAMQRAAEFIGFCSSFVILERKK